MLSDGHWDDTVTIKDKKSGQEEVLWQVSFSLHFTCSYY